MCRNTVDSPLTIAVRYEEGRNYLKYLRLKVIPEITSMLVDSSSYFIADGIVAGVSLQMTLRYRSRS